MRFAVAVGWCLAMAACAPASEQPPVDAPEVDPPNAGTLVPSPAGVVEGELVQATIGAQGGTLVSDDGRVEVRVPVGALAADTTLTMQRIASTAPGAVGPAVRLTKPAAVSFLLPVSVAFTLTPREVLGVDVASLGVGFQNGGGFWEKQAAAWDASTSTISTTTLHFSDWSALAGRQLRPGIASVQTKRALPLQVEWCQEVTADARPTCKPGGAEPCLVAQCRRTSIGGGLFSGWSVNAVEGGNSQVGTVTASGSRATFTAPATVPNPPTVAISVRLDPGLGSGDASTLVSNITITEFDEYRGEVYFGGLQGETFGGWGTLVFRRVEKLPDVSRYVLAEGSFSVTITLPDCDPVRHVPFPAEAGERGGAMVLFEANSGAGPTYFWDAASTSVDVPVSCGRPRTTTTMPLGISFAVSERPYDDKKELIGKQSPLPLGGGVAWFFDRVAQ